MQIGNKMAKQLLTGQQGGVTSKKYFSLGPGGGGALYNPAINPQDDKNIFIVCDMGSNFFTTDGVKFRNPNLYSNVSRPPRFFFHPHDENVVYATSNNIVQISHNKGETWEYFFPQPDNIAGVTNDGAFVRPIVKPLGILARSDVIGVYVHPSDPNTVFVFSRGGGYGYGFGSYPDNQNISTQPNPAIYVTRNGGLTWNVFNDTIPGGRITTGDNGRFPEIISGDGVSGLQYPYANMVIFKNELHLLSNHGYFRFNQTTGALIDHKIYRNGAGQFHISEDGATLSAYQIISRDDVADSHNNAGYTTFPGFVSMGLVPRTSLYPRHIFKTTDYGNTFELVSGNFATDLVYTFHGLNRKMHSGIASSSNARGYVNLKDISVSDDGTLHVVFSAIGRNSSNADLSDGWESGVAKTTNDGQTWEWIQMGRHVPASIQFPTGTSPLHLGTDPGHSQRGLSVAKFDTNHIITFEGLDTNETRDGGLTWRTMSSHRINPDGLPPFTTNGIEPAGQMTLAINPFNHQHHFAGWTDIGAWESLDGGKSWTRRQDMAWSQYSGNCSSVAFDPHNEGVVLVADPNRQRDIMRGGDNVGYVTVSSGEDWETAVTGRTGNIKRSIDGGKTWTVVQPYIIVGIDGLVFDPIHPGVVYAGTMGGGVCRSVDGGINWHPFNTGLPVQIRSFNNTEYCGIQIQRLILGKDKKTLLALYGGTAGMYSLDIGNNATTWQEIPRSVDMLTVKDMDKAADGTLYVAPSARAATSGWENFNGAQIRPILLGGAFVSEDNGLTWRQIFDLRISVGVIRTASHNENIIYLGGGHKIWVSYKGKDTTLADWVELPGFHFVTPDLIVEDPFDPTRIYVTSWGGGTWSLPVPERVKHGVVSSIDAQRE